MLILASGIEEFLSRLVTETNYTEIKFLCVRMDSLHNLETPFWPSLDHEQQLLWTWTTHLEINTIRRNPCRDHRQQKILRRNHFGAGHLLDVHISRTSPVSVHPLRASFKHFRANPCPGSTWYAPLICGGQYKNHLVILVLAISFSCSAYRKFLRSTCLVQQTDPLAS